MDTKQMKSTVDGINGRSLDEGDENKYGVSKKSYKGRNDQLGGEQI